MIFRKLFVKLMVLGMFLREGLRTLMRSFA